MSTFDDLRELKADWNGYGAPPINPRAVDLAERLSAALREAVPDEELEVYPTGRESVQLEYDLRSDGYLEFEVFDGWVHALELVDDYAVLEATFRAKDVVSEAVELTRRFLAKVRKKKE